MNRSPQKTFPGAAALAAALILFGLPATLASAQAPAAPSARELTMQPAISDVSISRDGKHIAALTSPDGRTVTISVWKADAPDQPPTVIGSTRMRFLSVGFLKNDRLFVTAIQTLTVGSTRTHVAKQYVTDLAGENWRPLLPEKRARSEAVQFYNSLSEAELIDLLPLDPAHVLAVDHSADGEGDIYKVNVYTGAADRIEHGSEKFGAPQTDLAGQVRAKQSFDYDSGAVYIAQWIKHPDSGKWEEHFRWYAKDREPVEVVGFDKDPGIVYVRSSKGRDKAGIYAYDVRARKILEPLFEHKLFEAGGVIESAAAADYGQILGFTYNAEASNIYWTDPALAGIAKGLRTALEIKTTTVNWTDPGTGQTARISTPVGADARIVSWSENRSKVIVVKEGSNQPPEYYLLDSAGRLTLLGRSRPSVNGAALGEMGLVQYAARDGLMIPGFLTLPPKAVFGPGPYPAIILPHGGPWSRDEMRWDFSGWTSYLSSRGYAVLQPQFRGSEGWGQKLWRAGDGEWGQKMQDDKDDGAKWLIAQGVADPNRIAMFGYSYGGYSALAAAIRPNGLYQCAISGAGAGDLTALEKATFENRFQREFQHPTIRGLDALDRAREASIPLFIYHGDRDQIVEVEQSKKFAAELKAAGKPYKLSIIPDMGHTFDTWGPGDGERQLNEIEAYLKTDCGPGGL